jgi:hypothetical protein
MAKTSSKASKKQPIQINYSRIPLQLGETSRLIITQSKDGTITVYTKMADREMPVSHCLGLMELGKDQVLDKARTKNYTEEVEITLDQIDAAMDHTGELQKAGLEIGVPIKVSRFAANMREQRRAEFLMKNPQNSSN